MIYAILNESNEIFNEPKSLKLKNEKYLFKNFE